MNIAIKNNLEFYRGKKVLITGHTGFKGAWLTAFLKTMQADTLGYALPCEKHNLYDSIGGDSMVRSVEGNLLDGKLLEKTVMSFEPEIVIHLAAFGFVKECYEDPFKAYNTNLMGSLNLLEAIRKTNSVRSIVMVSTDKVYVNKNDGASYSEEDAIGNTGPYSSSKVCMEYLVKDYYQTYFSDRHIGIATARASNVLGGGDHIKTRLIPSILDAVSEGKDFEIRNPGFVRPWQSVFDVINGYLTLGRYLYNEPDKFTGEWNIGPYSSGIKSVSYVFEKIQESFGEIKVHEKAFSDVTESATLGLDINKMISCTDWRPSYSLDKTIETVVDFYRSEKSGENPVDICCRQIKDFIGE